LVRTRTKTVSKFTQLRKIMSQASISDIPTTSTADQEVLVKVEGVSKKFCRSLKKSLWYGVCDIAGELNPFARHGEKCMGHGVQQDAGSNASDARDEDLRDGEFYAVRDVSFELRRGECLGLIGHNGAGKTTLLKMLNGLIKPDRGRIEMNGRVGALIALGAGFNPILTGRENIYVNGSILGMSKEEIDSKIHEIIAFSEIGDFVDSPVQNYSSGMQVRLGFSIASALQPSIVLLDEVLAVGDMSFQSKCLNKIGALRGSGTAFILVSHNMHHINRFTTSGLHLSDGSVVCSGSPDDVIQSYTRSMLSSRGIATTETRASEDAGSLEVEIVEASFIDANGHPVGTILSGECATLLLRYIRRNPGVSAISVEVVLRLPTGEALFQMTSQEAKIHPIGLADSGDIRITFPNLSLRSTRLNAIIEVWDINSTRLFHWKRGIFLDIRSTLSPICIADLECQWHHQPGDIAMQSNDMR
jgi:ABC-type polysaccharide/polyol phosphate transport system ATPase subunit